MSHINFRAKLSIDVPYLLKKIMGVEFLIFRQKNTLDRRERTLKIDAWNESFCSRVVIKVMNMAVPGGGGGGGLVNF